MAASIRVFISSFENGIGYDGWEENEFAKGFGVFGIPSVWIIDKNGTIIAKELRNEKQLKQKISEILDQPYVALQRQSDL